MGLDFDQRLAVGLIPFFLRLAARVTCVLHADGAPVDQPRATKPTVQPCCHRCEHATAAATILGRKEASSDNPPRESRVAARDRRRRTGRHPRLMRCGVCWQETDYIVTGRWHDLSAKTCCDKRTTCRSCRAGTSPASLGDPAPIDHYDAPTTAAGQRPAHDNDIRR